MSNNTIVTDSFTTQTGYNSPSLETGTILPVFHWNLWMIGFFVVLIALIVFVTLHFTDVI